MWIEMFDFSLVVNDWYVGLPVELYGHPPRDTPLRRRSLLLRIRRYSSSIPDSQSARGPCPAAHAAPTAQARPQRPVRACVPPQRDEPRSPDHAWPRQVLMRRGVTCEPRTRLRRGRIPHLARIRHGSTSEWQLHHCAGPLLHRGPLLCSGRNNGRRRSRLSCPGGRAPTRVQELRPDPQTQPRPVTRVGER